MIGTIQEIMHALVKCFMDAPAALAGMVINT